MANPIWPTSLPRPDYGLSEGEVEGEIIRSSSDAGIAKQRPRYTAVAVPVPCTVTLTRAQVATFRTFVFGTLKIVHPFDWEDHITDSGTVTYRFTKRPTFTRVGYDQVLVGMTLERMPSGYAPPMEGGPSTPETLPNNTVAPAVTGQLYTGNTIVCSSGTWTGNPTPTLTYQWQSWNGSTWVAISGATSNSYTPSSAGQYRCLVTGTNSQGSIAAASNTVTVTVAPSVPQNTSAPVVTGDTVAGSTLTCSSGTWSANPAATYAYQWQIFVSGVWSNITGATNSSYATEETGEHRCRVTATNSSGSVSAVSNTVVVTPPLSAPVNTSLPVISGTLSNGNYYEDVALQCSDGTWNGNPTPAITYQWETYLSGVWEPVPGATLNEFTPGSAGDYRCKVSASNSQGDAVVYSEPVTVLQTPTLPENTVAPVASGEPYVGHTLSTTDGDWTGVPSPTITYQWQIFSGTWSNITDATSNTYDSTTVGEHRCAVTASNIAGSATSYSNSINVETPVGGPENSVAPFISGNAYTNSTLYLYDGVWDDGTTLSRQWVKDNAGVWDDVVGETGSSFVPTTAGTYACKVTGSDGVLETIAVSNSMGVLSEPTGNSAVIYTFDNAASDNLNLTTYNPSLSYFDNPNVGTEILVVKQSTDSIHGFNTAGSLQAVYPNDRSLGDHQYIEATVNDTDTTSQVALVARYVNYDCKLYAYFGGGGSTLIQNLDSTTSHTYSLGVTVGPGDVVSMEVIDDNTVALKINGVHTDGGTWPSPITLLAPQPSGDKAGFGLWSTTTSELSSVSQAVIDDFSAAEEAPDLDYAPQIYGSGLVNEVLTATYGVWFAAPEPTYAFLWQRWDGSAWAAASGTNNLQTYTPTANGDYRCQVTATNSAGAVAATSSSITVTGGSTGTGVYTGARILFDETWGAPVPMLSTIEIRSTVGGPKITGTVTASSYSGSLTSPDKAYDTNTDSYWEAQFGVDEVPYWDIEFDTPSDIKQVLLGFPNIDSQFVEASVKAFRVQSNDNGTLQTIRTVTNDPKWSPGTNRLYNI